MPREGKGKRSGHKKDKHPPAGKRPVQHDDDDDEDDASVGSCETMTSTFYSSEDSEGHLSEWEKYELRVKEAIDMAQEKSVASRLKGLKLLRVLLQERSLCDMLQDHHETVCYLLERSLKHGASAAERIIAAKLSATLLVSVLDTDAANDVYRTLQPLLLTLCQDKTVSCEVREVVARTVGVLAYFGAIEYTDLQDSINTLHALFAGALPKGNGELPKLSPSAQLMHASALQGFFLLLTLANTEDVIKQAPTLLAEMMSVLESPDLEMRTEVGTGLALLYEIIRTKYENFRWRREDEMIDLLTELATDSTKYRAKKDRKLQRAVFRSVVTFIEDDELVVERITLGGSKARQVLELDSWELKYKYESVCAVLEQGLSKHLSVNFRLRDIFALPPVDAAGGDSGEQHRKDKRRYVGQHKQRNRVRNKNRDNRAQDSTYDD